jgi:hypothetical protein
MDHDHDSGEDTENIVSDDEDKNAMDAKELRAFFDLPEK